MVRKWGYVQKAAKTRDTLKHTWIEIVRELLDCGHKRQSRELVQKKDHVICPEIGIKLLLLMLRIQVINPKKWGKSLLAFVDVF